MITPAYSPTATERVLPRMALDFTTGVLDPRVTVTRALDTATRTNSSGYIEVINANLPRFDYDPVTLAPKGLLIEEARTNLVLQSQTFQTTWTNQETTEQVNAGIAPDGLLTAEKLIPTIVNDSHWINQNITVSAGLNTFSFYAKAAGYSVVQALNSPTTDRINFDLSNGTVGSTTGFTGTITAVGNGWYRCTATTTTTATTSGWARIGIVPSSTSARGAAFAGDGTSGVLIWGAQMELGAFATSYIPTTTTSLTRNADQVTMTGTNFSDWYTTAGNNESWFSQFISANIKAGDRLLAFDTGFAGGSAYRTPMGNAFNQLGLYDGTAERTFGAMPLVGVNKAATAYSGVTCSGTLNAAVPTSRAFDGNMNPSTVFGIGSYSAVASGFMNGWMQKIAYYPLRLSDAELRAITK